MNPENNETHLDVGFVLKNNLQKLTAEAIYLFLIFFFCYTAANKMVKLDSFKDNLIKTIIFSKDAADVFSLFVIALEAAVILLLIFYKRIGLLIFSFVMLTFTVYISFLRFKGLYEVCGCGGILNGLSYSSHFAINILLLLGGIYSFFVFNNQFNNEK